jgi:DNA-binding MarR family transcriptional regulator
MKKPATDQKNCEKVRLMSLARRLTLDEITLILSHKEKNTPEYAYSLNYLTRSRTLSVEEMAQILGISGSSVYRMLKRLKLK